MATADLDFTIKINGTPDEIIAILKVMREYDNGKDGVYFSGTNAVIGGENISFFMDKDGEKLFAAVRAGADSAVINSCGPYGRYGMLDDIDIFRDMAEAAPSAQFEGVIDGNAGYADQKLTACLTDGKLNISTFYLSDDVRGEAEEEYLSHLLPYEEFIELFRLDGDEFDEDMYADFLIDAIDMGTFAEFFQETDYEEFIELIDVDCPLDEGEYKEIVERLADIGSELGNLEDFMEEYADCQEFVYDPVAKKYIDREEPVLKSNTAFDATDMIKSYLQENGLPHDDATIAALSVEDVYSIMAGTYGKDTVSADESGADVSEESTEEIAKEFDKEVAAQKSETVEISEDTPSAEAEASACEANDTDGAEEAAEGENKPTDEENTPNEEATAEEVAAEDTPTNEESNTAASAEAAEAEEAAAESAANEEASVAVTTKKRSKAWIVWLVIVIILAALAAAYVFFKPAAEVVNTVIERIAALLE